MNTQFDDVLFIDEQQMNLILSVLDREITGYDFREHIRKTLDLADASQITEWLYYDARELKEKILLHTADPVFIAQIFDSNTLSTMGLYESGLPGVSEYYNKAKNVFIKLGAMKKETNALLRRPPSYIKEHSCNASKVLSSHIRQQNDELCVFGVVCSCGCSSFSVTGKRLVDDPVLYDRITLRCVACGSRIDIFDSKYNGYDGVLGHQVERQETAQGGFVDLSCPKCNGAAFHVAAGFEHTVDKEEAKDIVREEKLKVKREDLFSWFISAAQCTQCNHIFIYSDVECA